MPIERQKRSVCKRAVAGKNNGAHAVVMQGLDQYLRTRVSDVVEGQKTARSLSPSHQG